jgi:hypothetical protein
MAMEIVGIIFVTRERALTAELKTMAIKKVGVDAVCAVVALMPDLQTSESLRKTTREEKTHTWHIIKVRTH